MPLQFLLRWLATVSRCVELVIIELFDVFGSAQVDAALGWIKLERWHLIACAMKILLPAEGIERTLIKSLVFCVLGNNTSDDLTCKSSDAGFRWLKHLCIWSKKVVEKSWNLAKEQKKNSTDVYRNIRFLLGSDYPIVKRCWNLAKDQKKTSTDVYRNIRFLLGSDYPTVKRCWNLAKEQKKNSTEVYRNIRFWLGSDYPVVSDNPILIWIGLSDPPVCNG